MQRTITFWQLFVSLLLRLRRPSAFFIHSCFATRCLIGSYTFGPIPVSEQSSFSWLFPRLLFWSQVSSLTLVPRRRSSTCSGWWIFYHLHIFFKGKKAIQPDLVTFTRRWCRSSILKRFISTQLLYGFFKQHPYFRCLLPPLPASARILDIGSRLGAVLFAAHLFTESTNIVGVEINGELAQVRPLLHSKHFMNTVQGHC